MSRLLGQRALSTSAANFPPLSKWRHLTQYHGIWTFGIRFLRELTLLKKTFVLAACLAIPVVFGLADLVARRMDELSALSEAKALSHLFAAAAHSTRPLLDGRLAKSASERAAAETGREQAFTELATTVAASNAMDQGQMRSWQAFATSHAASTPNQLAASADSDNEWKAATRFLRSLESTGSKAVVDADSQAIQRALGSDMTDVVAALAALASQTHGENADRAAMERMIEARLLTDRVRANLAATATGTAAAEQLGADSLAQVQRYLHAWDVALANGGGRPSDEASRAAVEAAAAFQEQGLRWLANRYDARFEDARHRAVRDMLLSAVCALLCGYLLVCMYKVMRGGLAALCRSLALVGAGNLAREPVGLGKDEIGQALSSLGMSVRGMAALFSVVNQGVAAVSHAAREVAAGNAGLAVRTDGIRRDIGDVARRAREFAGAMGDCGALVDQAAEHVHAVRNETQRSRRAMLELRERMRSLQAKSQEITKIVGLMEATAYQTKLLSLNASVEASRAGEAGKGFSIVAAEVRALAQRSHDAAQRIRWIVGTSIELIEDGNVMTDRASASVQTTFEVTEAVDKVMGDIVSLTQSGLSDSREMQVTARQVEEAVEGNSRLVSQLSEASAALRSEGDKLKRSVHSFVFE